MPTITGVSGSTAHGGALTITGTAFGTKPTAAPVIWDDASGPANIRDLWEDGFPEGTVNPDFSIQRRTSGWRGVAAPHTRVGRYIAGCHANTPVGSLADTGYNVMFWKNLTATPNTAPLNLFVSFWQQIDPGWNFGTGDSNFKNFVYSIGSPPTGGGPRIWGSYGGHFPTSTTDIPKWQIVGEHATLLPDDPVVYGPGSPLALNPFGVWIKYEATARMTSGTDGFFRVHENGTFVLGTSNKRTDINTSSGRRFGIGGYARAYNQPTNYRYFTDCYLDTSHARVILGNSPTLNNTCTIREIQVCSAWSDTGITIPSFNRGVVGDATGAYLFVVDSANVASAGFEIGDAPDPPDPPLPNLVTAEIVPAHIPAIAGVRF